VGSCEPPVCFYHNFRFYKSSAFHSPANKEELFNLRHASARNVIERIFGVLKNRFKILSSSPHYDMALQARIPAALAAIHNFIMFHDPCDNGLSEEEEEIEDPQPGLHVPLLAEGPAGREERNRASAQWERIASDMWNQYTEYIS
jgi:DDE superfamily endonuclease